MSPLVQDAATIDSTNVRDLLELANAGPRSADIIDKLLWQRLLSMRRSLYEALTGRTTSLVLDATYRIYNALSPAQRARVLISSELCEALAQLRTACARQKAINNADCKIEIAHIQARLLDIVAREQAILDIEAGRRTHFLVNHKIRSFFSPLGDKRAVADVSGTWSVQRMPCIGEVVSIDFDSPLAIAHEARSGVLSQHFLPLSEKEKAEVVSKLQYAFERINATVPIYGLIICNFVRRIIIRKSYDRSEGEAGAERCHFGSEHVPRQPGSIRFLNAHLESVRVETCMESIMHESTHNFLAAWELANEMFVLSDPRNRVTSPWSGNQIPGSSFIHAIFVYYICYRLLRGYLIGPGKIDEEAKGHLRDRLANFMAGFLIRQDLPNLLLTERAIDPSLSSVLREMQTTMKGIHARDIAEVVT
jgi:hypothetical protein